MLNLLLLTGAYIPISILTTNKYLFLLLQYLVIIYGKLLYIIYLFAVIKLFTC